MKIPYREYTFESFVDQLLAQELPPFTRLKIACFLTDFSAWDQEKFFSLEKLLTSYGIRIEKLGQIRRLLSTYIEKETGNEKLATFYAYLNPESKLLLCFTLERKWVIAQTIGQIAQTASGFYYFFIGPKTFELLKKKILEEHPFAKCVYFTAKYRPEFARKSEVRPETKKTIMYHGEDGLKALEELGSYYGVRPRVMHFRIPDIGTYEVKNDGCFTLWSTEDTGIRPKKLLLNLIDIAVKDVLISRRIIETSNFQLIPIKTERKTFEIPKLTPWIINFSQDLEFADSEALLRVLAGTGYTVFNYTQVEGSLRLSGMVIDHNKNNIFTIDMGSREMIIAPRGKVSFDSFLRFYRVITENFDPEASCLELKEE